MITEQLRRPRHLIGTKLRSLINFQPELSVIVSALGLTWKTIIKSDKLEKEIEC